jgi:hypothetical protein
MRQPSMSTTFLRPGVDFEAKPRAEVRRNALLNMAHSTALVRRVGW